MNLYETLLHGLYQGQRSKTARSISQTSPRNKSVLQYETEFSRLTYYVNSVVATREDMCRRFQQGLRDEIHTLLVHLDILEYDKLLEWARMFEIDLEKSQIRREQVKRRMTTENPSSEIFEKVNESQWKEKKLSQSAPAMSSNVSQTTPVKCVKCEIFHRGECMT